VTRGGPLSPAAASGAPGVRRSHVQAPAPPQGLPRPSLHSLGAQGKFPRCFLGIPRGSCQCSPVAPLLSLWYPQWD